MKAGRKPRIPRVQVNTALPLDLVDAVDKYSASVKLPRVRIVELALRRFIAAEAADERPGR